MRASLIIFGVIFLVIGALLYLVPMQSFQANTTTSGNGNTDVRSSSASVTVPVGWAYASAIVGVVLLIFGLAIPDAGRRNNSKKDSYDTMVETKEKIKVGKGNERKIVRERTERHKTKEDEDEE